MKDYAYAQQENASKDLRITKLEHRNVGTTDEDKRIRRLSGEAEHLETYLSSLRFLLCQHLPSLKELDDVFGSLDASVGYIKALFAVSQTKQVQRKMRYDRLKTEF